MPEQHIAIYARQSVDKKDSLSIDGQIDLCRLECNGQPSTTYIDKGYSGKNIKRPAFTELMRDASEGKISKIICYRLDRISRSITDFGSIWETLSKCNVEFVSVNEKFDTSAPMGRAMLYIIMVFAQLERETIAERITDNYYQRVKKGAWPGGPSPFGFQIAPKKGGICRLAPDENIDVVKRIFNMYIEHGGSLGNIAKKLTDEKTLGPKRSAWDGVTVNRILRNPCYVQADATTYAYYKQKGVIVANALDDFDGRCGCVLVGKRNANDRKYADMSHHLLAISEHAGIIDPQTFLICQHKLDTNKQIKNTGKGKYTWLSGLLKCGTCGYSLKVQNSKATASGETTQYLICSGRTNLHVCDARHSEQIPNVESYVEHELVLRLTRLAKQAKSNPQEMQNIGALKSAYAVAEQKISNLITSMADASAVTMKYVNDEIERLDAEKQELNVQLSSITSPLPGLDLSAFVNIANMPFEAKKMLAQMYIDKVFCTSDSTKIQWKL